MRSRCSHVIISTLCSCSAGFSEFSSDRPSPYGSQVCWQQLQQLVFQFSNLPHQCQLDPGRPASPGSECPCALVNHLDHPWSSGYRWDCQFQLNQVTWEGLPRGKLGGCYQKRPEQQMSQAGWDKAHFPGLHVDTLTLWMWWPLAPYLVLEDVKVSCFRF